MSKVHFEIKIVNYSNPAIGLNVSVDGVRALNFIFNEYRPMNFKSQGDERFGFDAEQFLYHTSLNKFQFIDDEGLFVTCEVVNRNYFKQIEAATDSSMFDYQLDYFCDSLVDHHAFDIYV